MHHLGEDPNKRRGNNRTPWSLDDRETLDEAPLASGRGGDEDGCIRCVSLGGDSREF